MRAWEDYYNCFEPIIFIFKFKFLSKTRSRQKENMAVASPFFEITPRLNSPNKRRQAVFPRLLSPLLLLLLLSATLLSGSVAHGQLLASGRVFARPNTVGSQSAQLDIMFILSNDVPGGSTIQVTVPESTSLSNGALVPCSISGLYQRTQFCQAISKSQITFQVPEDIVLIKEALNQISFVGVFFGPPSTQPTAPFEIQMTTKDGDVLLNDQEALVLNDIVTAEIQSSTKIQQINTIVVAEKTAVSFSVTTLNPIPATGGVQIRLPKWNPLGPQGVRESFITDPFTQSTSSGASSDDLEIDYSVLCSPKNGVQTTLKCTHWQDLTKTYDYITITDMFAATREAGKTFEFYVSWLRNGISQSPIDFEILTFAAQELQPDGSSKLVGLIDRGILKFEAQESKKIEVKDCKLEAKDPTVQEFSLFKISFKVPTPVEEGCIVTIQLPDDFDLFAGEVARIEGWGIFGRNIDLNFGIDESARVIKIVNQCQQYTAANTLTELYITQIKNPKLVKPTKSFTISIQDRNARGIAKIEAGLYFTPIGGFITDIGLKSMGGDQIELSVDVKLTFKAPHAVSGTSYILMRLPEQIKFGCDFSEIIGLKNTLACEILSFNVLKFQNPFEKNQYDGGKQLSVVFRDLVLPKANLMIKGIMIETHMTLEDGRDYLVDEFDDPELEFFAPKQQLFLASSIFVQNEETYEETVFVITNKLANNVDQGAIIYITIPKQIEVKDAKEVVSTCRGEKNLMASAVCELVKNDDDSHLLTVKNAFGKNGLSRDSSFGIQIERGLLTPISKKTSETFIVILTDEFGHEINYVKNSLSLTMAVGKDIEPIALEVGSDRVGDLTSHTVSFKTPTPVYDGFLIIVNIPEECSPPMNSEFQCTVSHPLSETDTKCRINGQRVTVEIAIAEGYVGERIAVGENISLDFSLIRNPSSTVPTQPYDIQIRTNGYHLVAQPKNPKTSVENKTPAEIPVDKIAFEALELRQLLTTTLTLTWENTQIYPEQLAVLLKYNPEQFEPVNTRPGSEPGQQVVTCIFSRTVDVDCIYDEAEPGVIKIVNILQAEQNPGLQLSLTLTNQKILVKDPLLTESWEMTTYTDSSTQYSIDSVKNGLSFEFQCRDPCLTCLPGQPDMCTSCNTIDEYLILYDYKCSSDCPERTYKEAFQCYPCDEKCKTCTENSGSTCTSCYGGYSGFPFLYGNTCVKECEYGFYGNRRDADCQSCEDPCETCAEESWRCTSCKMPAAGEKISNFYHDFQCKDRCPDGWIADVPTRSNVCERCNSNCRTCFDVADRCETCPDGWYLNKLDQTCVQRCPFGITVTRSEIVRGSTQQVCEPCDSKCVTCGQNSPTFCTSCQDNLSLVRTTGECKLECDESSFTQVSLNDECVGCSSGCKTCQHSQDNCLSCDTNSRLKYLSGNKCVEQCPSKNGYQYDGDTEQYPGTCVIPGIQCGFGYELIPSGDGCAFMKQICISPNTLNYDKTTCVPGSDQQIPFPMLAFFFGIALVVAVSKCRARKSRFVANLIVFGSCVETGGMIVVLYFAYDFGIAPVVYMMLFALMFHAAINLFFFIVFRKQIMNDLTFRHWVTYNKCTVHSISFFGLVLNFKIYRLLYSEFCGAKRYDAPFRDPYKFFTPLNLASFLNLLVVKLVCMVACIFCIYYVPWGYQLMMECFEFLIIEVIMLALYITEYCQLRSSVMARKAAWKVDSKEVQGHAVKVMAGFEDDDQDPDAYLAQEGKRIEKRLVQPKPKALKTIVTMQQLLATKLVKKHAIQHGCDNTTQEIDLLHEKELMLRNRRRCMSFRLERPDFREAWGLDSDDDDADQNFISEPGSPRSKEMLHNPYFLTRMHALNRAYQMSDQFDNCYAEAKDPSVWPLSNVEQHNKKLQTNVMELLGVDDLIPDTQTQVTITDHDDAEVDSNQAANLINGVIARIDSDYDDRYGTNDQLLVRKGSDPNAENYSSQYDRDSQRPPKSASKMNSTMGKRRRKRLTRRRMAELPNFDVEEILGEFELDPEGNFIILQTANGKLNDKYGRLVNRRGYLVDPEGNVVTRGNVFIFYKEEIDFDDEVPAPYCFQKAKNVKYTVKNFSTHRRMRKKDKLAMQDEFIEREYLKLKQQARQKGGVQSQQHSQQEAMGINQSLKVHDADTTMNKPVSSHMRNNINNSGTALLAGGNSSQRLGDISLSNIILHDRAQNDMFDDADGLNADAFMAQNATTVKRKPPSSRHSQSKRHSRVGRNKHEAEANSIDPEDDELINDVTEPMKAKTKNELLGTGNVRSRQSSRSRSRSKSNERSQRSSKKSRGFKIKDGKMLNENSHRSLDKIENSEQSEANIMAMPTAGEATEQELRNLDFDNRKLLNNSSSMNFNKQKSKKSVMSGQMSRSGLSNNNAIYENEIKIHQERKQAVINDEEFLKKVQQFNSYLDKKKITYNIKKQGRDVAEPISQAILDDTYLNPDGSVKQVGLAHKYLNNVYGRVRTKFNKQIRQEGAGLKFRPQGSSYRNRVDEPRRLIAGMTYGQRERMLQMEINNLIDNNTDQLSLTTIQNKLAGESSTPQNSRQRRINGSGAQNNLRNHEGKMNELRGIYSDYRLDGTSGAKSLYRGGAGAMASSPRSHGNHLTFEASQILQSDIKEAENHAVGRHVDNDLRNVSQRVQAAQQAYANELNRSSNKSSLEANKLPVKSNRTAQGGTRKTPVDILHGKYL